jgi:hypothetical protein
LIRAEAAGHRCPRHRWRLADAALAATAWATLIASGPAAALAAEQAIFTDFEDIETAVGQPFSLGDAPARASFGGDAWSGIAGQPALYFSGLQAWMVEPGGAGSIVFETPAAIVEFHARAHPSATAPTRITAHDPALAQVDQIELAAADGWTLVAFTGPLQSIDVENLDATLLDAIDDFGFTPVEAPEPASALGAVGALIGLALTWVLKPQ